MPLTTAQEAAIEAEAVKELCERQWERPGVSNIDRRARWTTDRGADGKGWLQLRPRRNPDAHAVNFPDFPDG